MLKVELSKATCAWAQPNLALSSCSFQTAVVVGSWPQFCWPQFCWLAHALAPLAWPHPLRYRNLSTILSITSLPASGQTQSQRTGGGWSQHRRLVKSGLCSSKVITPCWLRVQVSRKRWLAMGMFGLAGVLNSIIRSTGCLDLSKAGPRSMLQLPPTKA